MGAGDGGEELDANRGVGGGGGDVDGGVGGDEGEEVGGGEGGEGVDGLVGGCVLVLGGSIEREVIKLGRRGPERKRGGRGGGEGSGFAWGVRKMR